MPNFSKFSAISNGQQRIIDLSNASNILELGGGLQLDGSSSGHVVMSASATTTNYTITWPNAQSVGAGILTNNGSGVLSWAAGPAIPGVEALIGAWTALGF